MAQTYNVAIFRLRMRSITLLASPLPIVNLYNFFVAICRKASRIRETVLLDVDDGRSCREVVRNLRHAQVLFLDLHN